MPPLRAGALRVSRPDRQARRQRGVRSRARRRRRRCGCARRRCRRASSRRAPAPISSRRCEACGCSSPGRSPTASAPPQALRARGHDVVLAPLLRIETVAIRAARTARSAPSCSPAPTRARAIAEHPRRAQLTALPAFAVGRRTAEAARAAGLSRCPVRRRRQGRSRRVSCAPISCARTPMRTRAAALSRRRGPRRRSRRCRARLPVHTVVVYRAVKAARFPPDVAAALARGAIDGVLHFSPRSAEAYLDCAAHDGIRAAALAPVHYCLSRQVAEPLSAAGAAGDPDRGPPRRGRAAGARGIGVRATFALPHGHCRA